ncbi:MAG TPA: FAD-binding oxidoreductase [Candidatus Binataceae bacterium]|nr:FAD-binding oxidoreductase [Candidatus Binataceae bacterium]
MDSYDYIIVGGGIAGASAGFELATHGKVLLIEREAQFGYHSTGRSAAVFLKSHGPDVIRALATASKRFLLDPPAGFTDYPLLRPRGMMFIGGRDDHAALERAAEECARYVDGARWLSPVEARAMVPVLREDCLGGAVFDPEAMDIDVHSVHYGFLHGLRTRGGITVNAAELLKLDRSNGTWTVTTSAGDFAAPVVLNAAGAWCDRVAAIAGAAPIGLVPKRRTAFIFDPPEGAAIEHWPVVHDIRETFYFKPDARKLLASPADETPMEPCDVHPDDLDIATAVDRIQRHAALPVTHINRKWAGLRSFVADGCPVVGYDPRVEGFFWIAGQGGYGIETSPAMARLSASLASGRGVPGDLADLGVTAESVSAARIGRR